MILCAGEALIDMLPRQTVNGEAAFAPYAGGAVFNTAIALGRLGAPVALFSGVSTDNFGDILVSTLAASRVETRLLARSGRPTTLAFVTFVKGEARYAFYDEATAGRMLAPEDLPELSDEIAALFFGGISLAVEPCARAYEALALREAPRRLVMIDPNIRPGFILDPEAYRARLEAIFAVADIVKVSDVDLDWLEGPGDIADRARKILARGPKLVFVTKGAEGAFGFGANLEVFMPANKVAVVDTVGAGDTFNAGVLTVLSRAGKLSKTAIAEADEALLRECLTLGAAAAAVTVSRAGANPPWDTELEA